jgi:cytochrome c biogenesis protein ResB
VEQVGSTVTKSILENAYLQGGAVLLLIALLVLAIFCIFKFIVKPLWDDNKALRDKLMENNEKVIKIGELSRISNETTAQALKDQYQTFRDFLSIRRLK